MIPEKGENLILPLVWPQQSVSSERTGKWGVEDGPRADHEPQPHSSANKMREKRQSRRRPPCFEPPEALPWAAVGRPVFQWDTQVSFELDHK